MNTADGDMNAAEEEIAFSYYMGKAVSQWAYVETQLQRLCTACVAVPDRRTVAAGFLAIENFRSKLAYADTMLKATFAQPPHIAVWTDLHKRLKTLSFRRNQIVHRVATFYPDGAPGRRFALLPWTMKDEPEQTKKAKVPKPKKPPRPPSSAMCVLALDEARNEFHALTTALAKFFEVLLDRPEPFARVLTLPTGQTTLRKAVQPIRKAFRLPKKQ